MGPREGLDGFGEGKMSCPCRYLYCRPTSVWHSRCTDYAPGVENIQYFSKLQLSSAVLFIIYFFLFIYLFCLFIYLFCLFIYLFCLFIYFVYLFIYFVYLFIYFVYLFIYFVYLFIYLFCIFIYFTKAIVVGVKYKVI